MMDWYDEIKVERIKQDEEWGEQNHTDLRWNPILGEERGEAEKALNELYPAIGTCQFPEQWKLKLVDELIQVAAVCVAWLEAMDRREE